jgi:hypothetical protein
VDNPLLQFYIEKEAILSRSEPSLPYVALIKKALQETAREFEESLSNEKIQQAVQSLSEPPTYSDSAHALKDLSDLGYSLCLILRPGNIDFSDTIRATLPFDLNLSIVEAPNIPLYLPMKQGIDPLVLHATGIYPGILPSQILVVTSSRYRTVEMCHPAGIPTAHIRRPTCLEANVFVASPSPSLIIENLDELVSNLRRLSLDPETPLPRDPTDEEPAEDLPGLPGYRMAAFYQYRAQLGSGSFSKLHPFNRCAGLNRINRYSYRLRQFAHWQCARCQVGDAR